MEVGSSVETIKFMMPMPQISKWSLKLLRWFCPDQLLEEIEGDLIQKYENDLAKLGAQKAKRKFIWNVVRYFRPGILWRNKLPQPNFSLPINYFRFAWRNMQKHKIFSSINIIGLSIGMSVCMLITNYVLFEKSYDQFNENINSIFRITYSRFIDGEFQYSKAQVFPAIAEAIKQSVPDIENVTRIFPVTENVEAILSIENNGEYKSFAESSIVAVDSSFLKIFTLSLISGDKSTSLVGENKVLLSSSIAHKFFGELNPIGKTIYTDGMGDWQVTGVFNDLPENSHMKFNIIVSWMNVYGERSAWNWDGFFTYVLLRPNANVSECEKRIEYVLDKKLSYRPDAARIKSKFSLQSLKDIHLNSHLQGEMRSNGNGTVVIILQLVALTILVLAVINYIILSLARTIKRAKEVRVRKIIGATRTQLTMQLFAESFIYNLLSVIIAIALFFLTNTSLSTLIGKPISQEIWNHSEVALSCIIAALIFISLLASYYPTKIILSRNELTSLTGIRLPNANKGFFRKSLLTTQFAVTLILITGCFVIHKQVTYMQNQKLGFNLDQNLIIKTFAGPGAEMDSSFNNKLKLFKSEIKAYTEVRNVTITSTIPGRENSWVGRLRRSESDSELISIGRTRVDSDFINTYGLQLSAGSNFTNEDSRQVIINQTAVKMLGYQRDEDALGTKVMGDYDIVGVVNDYHEQSLHEPIKASMFTPGEGYMKYMTISIKSNSNFKEAINDIKREWKLVYPDIPFEYFFLDDFFNKQYQQELQLSRLLISFSGIGAFIACLGLFGFTYYSSHQRVKEIGIRKTLGATAGNLLKLLTVELGVTLLVAGLVATPFSYFLSAEWLTHYQVRISPNAYLFLFPVMLVGLLAFLSISVLLLKAVRINPNESLKHE